MAKATRKQIPDKTLCSVRSNVTGNLIYESQMYSEIWHNKDDVLDLPFEELVDIRRKSRGFFENNWIIVDDAEGFTPQDVYATLGVSQYYSEKANGIDLDDIISMKAVDIPKAVEKMTEAQKANFANYIRDLLKNEDKRVDSKTKINALSKALGVDFNDED